MHSSSSTVCYYRLQQHNQHHIIWAIPTFISDALGSRTLQHSSLLYRNDAGERTGMRNSKAPALRYPSSEGNLLHVYHLLVCFVFPLGYSSTPE